MTDELVRISYYITIFPLLHQTCIKEFVYCAVALAFYAGRIYRNSTVWRPSVCPVGIGLLTVTRSPGDSMRRGQRTFRPDKKEDRHTCLPCDRRCRKAPLDICCDHSALQWRNYERRGEAIASGRLAQGGALSPRIFF